MRSKLHRPRAASINALAALFGAHHAAWCAESASHPFAIPTGFARFTPESLATSVRASRSLIKPGDEMVFDASIAEATRLRRNGDLTFASILRPILGDLYCNDLLREDGKPGGPTRRCNCSRHASLGVPLNAPAAKASGTKAALRKASVSKSATTGTERPSPKEHTPRISFDHITWVATATEHAVFPDVTLGKALEVFQASDPRYWDRCAPDTFRRTLVGVLVGGQFEEFEPQQEAPWPGEGLILEDVFWAFNRQMRGRAVNLLRFTDVVYEWREAPGAPADGASPTQPPQSPAVADLYEDPAKRRKQGWRTHKTDDYGLASAEPPSQLPYELRYGYKYELHHCLGADFLGSFQPGGLDIDEGWLSIVWNSQSQDLKVDALKSLRYSPQPITLNGFDRMMNLMAPALASMFMRQMVLRGVGGVLDGTINPNKDPDAEGASTPSEVGAP